jgi:hypothetical protein
VTKNNKKPQCLYCGNVIKNNADVRHCKNPKGIFHHKCFPRSEQNAVQRNAEKSESKTNSNLI